MGSNPVSAIPQSGAERDQNPLWIRYLSLHVGKTSDHWDLVSLLLLFFFLCNTGC